VLCRIQEKSLNFCYNSICPKQGGVGDKYRGMIYCGEGTEERAIPLNKLRRYLHPNYLNGKCYSGDFGLT